MYDLILIGLIIAILSLLARFYYESYQYWKRQGIPYIKPTIPPFGNTLKIYMGNATLGEAFADAYLDLKKRGEQHGGMYFLHTPVYIPVDPNIIKKIIISDAQYFANHGMYISADDDILSGHLFNMEDKAWKTLRTQTPSIFTTSKLKNMYLIMQNMVDPYMMWLDKYADSQEPIEIKNATIRFTTDIISACAFGINTNTLKNENEDILYHSRQFFDYQWSLYKNTMVMGIPRHILQAWKFRIFPERTEKYIVDMFKNIYNYRKQNEIKTNDLTDTLMKLTEKRVDLKDFTGKNIIDPMDLNQFSTQMFLFMCAGSETSSSTQTFALYELAKNPECQNKVRQEIERVLKKHNNEMTYEALMDMKYLERCIDETLRIYPILPILPRLCKEDYKILDTGFTLKKGSLVLVTNLGIQRDPDYYPDPLQFDPERWTNENRSNRPFVANLPFGEGPRICVGKRFGLLQTKLGLATLIKNYEVRLSDRTKKGFKFVSSELILRKDGDVWLQLKKIRNQDEVR